MVFGWLDVVVSCCFFSSFIFRSFFFSLSFSFPFSSLFIGLLGCLAVWAVLLFLMVFLVVWPCGPCRCVMVGVLSVLELTFGCLCCFELL